MVMNHFCILTMASLANVIDNATLNITRKSIRTVPKKGALKLMQI